MKFLAHYQCKSKKCRHRWKTKHTQVTCPKCRHVYVDWLNFEELRDRGFKP